MTFHKGAIEEFNVWHAAAKISEGIPPEGKIGYVNGVKAPNNQRTIAYSKPIAHPINKDDYVWICGKYEAPKKKRSPADIKAMGWFPGEL